MACYIIEPKSTVNIGIHAIERSIISQGRHFGLDVGQQNRLLDRIGMVSGLIVIFPFHSY